MLGIICIPTDNDIKRIFTPVVIIISQLQVSQCYKDNILTRVKYIVSYKKNVQHTWHVADMSMSCRVGHLSRYIIISKHFNNLCILKYRL